MLIATSAFAPLATEVAATLGVADLRIVEVDHPLGGIDADAVTERADSAVEATLRRLTSSSGR